MREGIDTVPMEFYYSWSEGYLEATEFELELSKVFNKTGVLSTSTPYIDEVMKSDLIIDFSGDIWGDNADFLGKDRFYIGLCKDRIAQLLGKKTVMIAGSPGPFTDNTNLSFAKEVFAAFSLVTNRESLSRGVLEGHGFNLSNSFDFACPAFLFEGKNSCEMTSILEKEGIKDSDKLMVGFILCGWNFLTGPFDKWPRKDSEYLIYVKAIEHLESLGVRVCLMSHSNGFVPGKLPFELLHGRDYPIVKQLQKILKKRGKAKDVVAFDGVYDAWTTKAIIGNFEMLVSGRIHGAVAGLSQYVPTVIIDYGHEPKAHKLKGFAIEAGAEEYVADPTVNNDLISKIDKCWTNKDKCQADLLLQIPRTKEKAKNNFRLIKELF